MHNIGTPNLPDSDVGLVLVKNDISLINRLNFFGIQTLSPEKNTLISDEVSEHPDILCCMTEQDACVVSREQTQLKRNLSELGFHTVFSEKQVAGNYPGDIILNFAIAPGFVLGNIPFADRNITYCLKNKNEIRVKQGYAKCSTCFVSGNAFITEDPGIAEALTLRGFDVLKISNGEVYLSDIHTGFFGGATGKISKDILAINGSLDCHRDGNRIREFLSNHGVKPLELFPGKIRDTGGIIPLQEV